MDEVCWGTQEAWEDVHFQAGRAGVDDLPREAFPLAEGGSAVVVVLAFAPDHYQKKVGQR